MKNLFKYSIGALLAGVMVTACSPDSFDGADEMGVPSVSDKDFDMTVDQETNQVQVSFAGVKGAYPVWIFNGTNYSTLNNVGYQNNKKGNYYVELKLGNRNGFSQGSIRKEFTFNETKASYTTELSRLNGKKWRINHAEPAHLACGPYGGDGAGWWSASPEEKRGTGMYDDFITFTTVGTSGGTFTYNPGEDGLTYVNKATTIWGSGASEDFDATTQEQTATFELMKDDWKDLDGNVIETNYMVLGDNTLFPYISADSQYKKPRFRIETLTASTLVMIYENKSDDISWRFIFTSKDDKQEIDPNDPAFVNWVAVDSPDNLGRDFNTRGRMNFWWADAGWQQIGDPQFSYADGVYTVLAKDATAAEWQAQNSIQNVAMNIEAGQTYDISVKLISNQALGRFTFKVCEQNDDDNTLIYRGDLSLDAGENLVQFANVKAQKNGSDSGFSEAKLFIDLGGCPAGLEVKLSDIIIQKHVNSSGGGFSWADVNSPDNIGNGFNSVGAMDFWWADAGWGQIGNPGFAFENGVYIITASDNGGSEWQAQNSIHHVAMNIEAGQLYAVRATIDASDPVGRYTFKICDEGDDDNTLIYNGSLSLDAGENIVEFLGVKAQKNGADSGFKEAKLFIDLGGVAPGTVIRLKDIIVQKYDENAGGGSQGGGAVDYDNAGNLWKAVDNGEAFVSVTPWFANDGWSQIGNPVWSHDGNTWELTIPEGMGGSQWQGQFPINTTIATKQNDKYTFSCTILADQDCNGVTIKLTETDEGNTKHDNNFYCTDRHDVKADEPYVYTITGATLPQNDAHALSLFFDFGGSPIGTNVKISNIILVKE